MMHDKVEMDFNQVCCEKKSASHASIILLLTFNFLEILGSFSSKHGFVLSPGVGSLEKCVQIGFSCELSRATVIG